jgi:prepilin-type processing-associated H-X9-DG protein
LFKNHVRFGPKSITISRAAEVVTWIDSSSSANGHANPVLWNEAYSDERSMASEPLVSTNYASCPVATIRYRQGKGNLETPGAANAAFVDGHAATIPYGKLLHRNFSIAY